MIQRQESTIYEEELPVVMRRRGVTMRVRIVSVDSPTSSAPNSPWTVRPLGCILQRIRACVCVCERQRDSSTCC